MKLAVISVAFRSLNTSADLGFGVNSFTARASSSSPSTPPLRLSAVSPIVRQCVSPDRSIQWLMESSELDDSDVGTCPHGRYLSGRHQPLRLVCSGAPVEQEPGVLLCDLGFLGSPRPASPRGP